MDTERQRDRGNPASTIDRALRRIVAEIVDGLQHGHFDLCMSCEVIGRGRRRLILRAGKNYQFLIPGDECGPPDRPKTPDDRSLVDAGASHRPNNHPFGDPHVNPNDSTTMRLFNDLFMAEFVTNAEEAAAEPDERARALQMAALAANILSRLATSELLESDTQKQAAMLAVRLVVNLHLEILEIQ